jgi:steroid delta-isomerase-like uncharacterized protein
MTRTSLEASQKFLDEVLNSHNLDAIDDLVAENYAELDPAPGQGPGRDGLRQALATFNESFPDNHWNTDERVVEGNKIVTRFHWTGTHKADFIGIPATDKSVSVKGVVIDEFQDGQMVRSRILMDQLGLLQQLGVIPPMGLPA